MGATAVTATNVTLVINTGTASTGVAVTATGANAAEVLSYTPTKGCERVVINVNNIESTASNGTVAVNISAGDYWAGTAMTEVTVAKTVAKAFVLESARYKDTGDDHIHVTLTPYSGEDFTTNYTVYVTFMELP